MCTAIALPVDDMPEPLMIKHGLGRRVHDNCGRHELHFLSRDYDPLLPVRHEGQLRLVRWGNRRNESRKLPCTAWTWQETIERGGWLHTNAELVEIPARRGYERGIWFSIKTGVQGLLVADEREVEHVYMVCEPTTRDYLVMTKGRLMPVLIRERLQ